jgi:8-oxo-dGTP pyrophosphatase MutT (NUDIX family)
MCMPELRDRALRQITCYQSAHPDRHAEAQAVIDLLGDRRADPFARKNMPGHITASALVLNRAHTHVLLIHHAARDKWMQPGGHVEPGASLVDTAIAEVAEETGVTGLSWLSGDTCPFDIDIHHVSANPANGEAEHHHLDVLFLAEADDTAALVAEPGKILGVKWVPLEDLPKFDGKRLTRLMYQTSAYLKRAA